MPKLNLAFAKFSSRDAHLNALNNNTRQALPTEIILSCRDRHNSKSKHLSVTQRWENSTKHSCSRDDKNVHVTTDHATWIIADSTSRMHRSCPRACDTQQCRWETIAAILRKQMCTQLLTGVTLGLMLQVRSANTDIMP